MVIPKIHSYKLRLVSQRPALDRHDTQKMGCYRQQAPPDNIEFHIYVEGGDKVL